MLESERPAARFRGGNRRAAERAAALTGQLLAFSRQQVLQPKVINVNKVLENIQKMLRRLIGEDIHLHAEPADDLHSVRADSGQLENVLMNLVVNAATRCPAAARSPSKRKIFPFPQATECPAGDYVLMSVADTGVGIPGM